MRRQYAILPRDEKMEWYWLTVFYQKRPTEELAHLALCLLVAVKLSQKQGKIRTDLQIHMFIMQWLTTAQKRKLFPRSVAQDILWLINEGGVRLDIGKYCTLSLFFEQA
ncbi:DUF2913 family protein [Erwinia tracheiphila]|uniref:DUF2913 family protein n=1 Tax=Erwinia tracheiphila TaxID=65700 RepID=UPI000337C014|nr:DUF2913 family protein [Erwinia tracheiphila]EOS92865.1 hypothetical protein ETR_22229 [Erwinia tracheiphila PSU-1]